MNNFRIDRIAIEPELLESLYWGNGYTLQDIADIFGCSLCPIDNRMKKYGIPCRSRGNTVTDFTFNDRQKEIFEGCMLGDGALEWTGNNCQFRNTDTFEEYLIWLQKQLGVERISRIAPAYNSDFNDIIDKYRLTTRVIPSIRDEHKRWYPYETRKGTYENRQPKIFPKNIEITPIKMLFWYIGDGCYDKRDDVAHFGNHLDFDTWKLLSKKISKVLYADNGVSINKSGKDDNGNQIYRLCLSKSMTRKFFDMVDSLDFVIPKCYYYKFGRLSR